MNKRHAKPTAQALVNRIYRRQIAMESETRSALAMLSERVESMYEELHRNDCLTHHRVESIQTDIDSIGTSLADTLKTVTDHCRRLLKEKETLQKMVSVGDIQQRINQANAFMAERANGYPLPCGFASTHRPGVLCSVCGQMS